MTATGQQMTEARADLSDISDDWQLWSWGTQLWGMVRRLDERRYVAVVPYLYTWAIIEGPISSPIFHDRRWCYRSFGAAVTAVGAWDGQGAPQGWLRELRSDRG